MSVRSDEGSSSRGSGSSARRSRGNIQIAWQTGSHDLSVLKTPIRVVLCAVPVRPPRIRSYGSGRMELGSQHALDSLGKCPPGRLLRFQRLLARSGESIILAPPAVDFLPES